MNAYWESLEFELPQLKDNQSWRRWIDTSLVSPDDITPWQAAPAFAGKTYPANAHSVVVLWTYLA
jgi:glycogen operon protein